MKNSAIKLIQYYIENRLRFHNVYRLNYIIYLKYKK